MWLKPTVLLVASHTAFASARDPAQCSEVEWWNEVEKCSAVQCRVRVGRYAHIIGDGLAESGGGLGE